MSKPKAYSYTRMSTLEQLKGDSRRRQFARARDYAEKNGLDIVDRFDDWGVSAFRSRNADFGALKIFKERLDAGDIARGSYLIVESMDRLSRDKVMKALTMLTDIVSRGVILVTLDDGQVYSEKTVGDEHYRLLIALGSMTRAHEESKRKSSLVGEAWGEKKRRAREEGLVATSKVPGWLMVTSEGAIKEIFARVEVVREIFTLSRDGWGAFSVCRRLNERREPVWSTRAHAVWRESYIKKIVKSRTVLGEYQPHRIVHSETGQRQRVEDGPPIVGYYPAVIEKDLFLEANSAVAKRRLVGRGRKGAQFANLFSGLLRCSCGAGYRYIDKGDLPKGGKYLQCSVAYQKGACSVKPIRYELVETLLLSIIESLDVERVLGGESRNKLVADLRTRQAILVEQKNGAERKISRLVRALGTDEGAGSKALTIELRNTELEDEGLRAEIERTEEEIGALLQIDPTKRRQILDELFAKLREADSSDALVTRRALVGELQRMLRRVIVKPNVRVAWELTEEYSDWKTTFNVKSIAGLERIARDHSFDLVLVYHNGDTMAVDAMEGPFFRSKGKIQFKNWSYLSKPEIGE